MKVKELKELIGNLPPEADCIFTMSSGCCGDTELLEVIDADNDNSLVRENEIPRIVIRFNALPGYKTCRQASATKGG